MRHKILVPCNASARYWPDTSSVILVVDALKLMQEEEPQLLSWQTRRWSIRIAFILYRDQIIHPVPHNPIRTNNQVLSPSFPLSVNHFQTIGDPAPWQEGNHALLVQRLSTYGSQVRKRLLHFTTGICSQMRGEPGGNPLLPQISALLQPGTSPRSGVFPCQHELQLI